MSIQNYAFYHYLCVIKAIVESLILLYLSHFGELSNDLCNRISISHVVDVKSFDRDIPVEVTDELHVLQLGEDWVLKAFFEHIVVSLL